MLEPLHPSSGELQNLLEKVLNSRLDTEVAGSIMRHAEKYASGHERSLLREIHAQLEESTDEKTATELRQTLVTLFEAMLRCELDRHIALVMEMRVPYENLSLELNFSIEYFWDDELAIKGITLPGDYLSETGVWKNDEVEQGLAMSKMCVTSFFETG
jgi:Holliday junction resolvase RusA-like endonuclease